MKKLATLFCTISLTAMAYSAASLDKCTVHTFLNTKYKPDSMAHPLLNSKSAVLKMAKATFQNKGYKLVTPKTDKPENEVGFILEIYPNLSYDDLSITPWLKSHNLTVRSSKKMMPFSYGAFLVFRNGSAIPRGGENLYRRVRLVSENFRLFVHKGIKGILIEEAGTYDLDVDLKKSSQSHHRNLYVLKDLGDKENYLAAIQNALDNFESEVPDCESMKALIDRY